MYHFGMVVSKNIADLHSNAFREHPIESPLSHRDLHAAFVCGGVIILAPAIFEFQVVDLEHITHKTSFSTLPFDKRTAVTLGRGNIMRVPEARMSISLSTNSSMKCQGRTRYTSGLHALDSSSETM